MAWIRCRYCKRKINGAYKQREHIKLEHPKTWLIELRTTDKTALATAVLWLTNYREMQEELPGLPRLPQAYAALKKVLARWPYSKGEEWLKLNVEFARKRLAEIQARLTKYDEEHGGNEDQAAHDAAVADTD